MNFHGNDRYYELVGHRYKEAVVGSLQRERLHASYEGEGQDRRWCTYLGQHVVEHSLLLELSSQ